MHRHRHRQQTSLTTWTARWRLRPGQRAGRDQEKEGGRKRRSRVSGDGLSDDKSTYPPPTTIDRAVMVLLLLWTRLFFSPRLNCRGPAPPGPGDSIRWVGVRPRIPSAREAPPPGLKPCVPCWSCRAWRGKRLGQLGQLGHRQSGSESRTTGARIPPQRCGG